MAIVQTLIGNIKGPQGDTGATGAQGPQGDAATIQVGSVTSAAYGTPASVTNSGTTGAAVLDFVIPQGKPGEKTTKMGELTLDTITTSAASFPSPAVDDTGAVAFGKIRKFFADTLSALAAKIDTSKIADNLTTNDASYVLSAKQGKALNDSLANINTDTPMNTSQILTSSSQITRTELAKLTTGTYIIQCASKPSDFLPASAYGVLFIFGSTSNYRHAIYSAGDELWKINFNGTTAYSWKSCVPVYTDVSLAIPSAGTAIQINNNSGGKVNYANFINCYVLDTNDIVAQINTYANLLYVKFLTNTGSNAPAGTYKLRCWYYPT